MESEASAAEQQNQADAPLSRPDSAPNASTPTSSTPHDDAEVARLVQQLPQLLDAAGEALKQQQRENEALAEEVKALQRDELITGGGMFVVGLVFGIAISFAGQEWMLKRMR